MHGGDVQLALGAEYRKQSIDDLPDVNSLNGTLLGLTAATPTVGKDSVKEVYGEVFVPILADTPGFSRLNLTPSARYTAYKSSRSDTTLQPAGETDTHRGLRLRLNDGTPSHASALHDPCTVAKHE